MKYVALILGLALICAPAFSNDDDELDIRSPLDYQVFQRQSRLSGYITLSGRVSVDYVSIQCRISGDSIDGKTDTGWFNVPFSKADGSFLKNVALNAGGWYKIDFRTLSQDGKSLRRAVEHVGIGEVFVVAGQSNSTNCGEKRMVCQSGMMSSFNGSQWRLGNDPQWGTHDRTDMGSFLPAFGDAMYAKYKVPIGVASTGSGGTFVKDWMPNAGPGGIGEHEKTMPCLYDWMMERILFFGRGGFRGVLWHQGESDCETLTQNIYDGMKLIIAASNRDAGWVFPWFVAKASYLEPYLRTYENVREAHQRLWDDGVAIEGPDTDKITREYRSNNGLGDHFSADGLKMHGELWAERVGSYLDRALE